MRLRSLSTVLAVPVVARCVRPCLDLAAGCAPAEIARKVERGRDRKEGTREPDELIDTNVFSAMGEF